MCVRMYLCTQTRNCYTMYQQKHIYLCPQADVISFGARENFCQSSVNMGIGTGASGDIIWDDLGTGIIPLGL